jgi:hypothetical protein
MMSARQACSKLQSILAEQMMCAIVELWFDGRADGGYCNPDGNNDIVFMALVGAEQAGAKNALIGIERMECDLPDDYVGWARVFVEFKGPANADTDEGIYADSIKLIGLDPVYRQVAAAPLEDEPLPL